MAEFANSVTTRMRRTFRYPEEPEDDCGTREELDEQEQDNLIKELRKQDEQWNNVYKRIFTILPLACALAFIPPFLGTETSASQKLLCLLGLASLLVTAYTTQHDHALWPTPTDGRAMGRERPPSRDYTLLVNTGVCIFLAVMAWLAKGSSDTDGAVWILFLAPGVVLGVSGIAKRESSSVNIEELERLRYEYKGA